jgi:hypothetical protein
MRITAADHIRDPDGYRVELKIYTPAGEPGGHGLRR